MNEYLIEFNLVRMVEKHDQLLDFDGDKQGVGCCLSIQEIQVPRKGKEC